ncbi:hypothetical protein [Candidatus Aquarickettsia rohweri]|uniref:Uncharacterized protein n=1 Tax=Candidatus Aquarickettsia rohweri TaxID=2602574 RepID=A0A3S0FL43_9RICK|nr:hypothetical protein [Candidatus Aquarickettsia rohweri]MSO13519.1 hypothetical protein [Rickettsiales endosymbiont of Trichoplax sp. H2]RST62862.1 hypothetical protein EIC27_05915 [Candidatus Aquarickettsia rohweri]
MSEGLTTGGSIGGGMHIDVALIKDINLSFENLQKSKNLGSVVESSPVGAVARLGNALKGMKDVVALSSLTPTTALAPPQTPLGISSKVPGIMSRKG